LELRDVAVVAPKDDAGTVGLGRYGALATPLSAAALGERLAALLPATSRGVALAGDPDQEIRTIALLPGAGDSMLDEVIAIGVDAVLTSDLRHHVTQEAAMRGIVLYDAAHFATESPWMARLAEVVTRELPSVQVSVSQLNTDPFTRVFMR
ncbi:MAG: Nif3-like dinuclear metal center hexameric protein, partial [Bowdeniella nasicola]|nr:Nif3-like dinuclear metal center hexameric protein [Bowdeniella nasicola]